MLNLVHYILSWSIAIKAAEHLYYTKKPFDYLRDLSIECVVLAFIAEIIDNKGNCYLFTILVVLFFSQTSLPRAFPGEYFLAGLCGCYKEPQ
jgi:hypothetical protein